MNSSKVHHILAHSYAFYFIAFLAGLFLDALFPIKIFASAGSAPLGFALLILASLLIFWAQKTSHRLGKDTQKEAMTKETFCRGPYCYTRSPTHWGLLLLMLGFGMISNSFFIVIFTLVAFLITRFVFVKKMEKHLVDKYGAPYVEYKKIVRF